MKPSTLFIFACCFFIGVSCGQGSNSEGHFQEAVTEYDGNATTLAYNNKSAAREDYSEEEFDQNGQSGEQAPIERKIIKTVNYRIQVEDVAASTAGVEQLVEQYGGYISAMNQTNSSYEIQNQITIRVPQDKLDDLLNEIGKEALYTNYRSVSANDVTEEYLDLDIRLKTKKEVRDRYIDILRNQAKTVKDILEAEEKIRVIQEEIESTEGRLRYLQNQVSMSTIHLDMYQRVEYQEQPDVYRKSFGDKLLSSLEGGWNLLVGLFLFLVNIWPLLIILALIIWRRKWLFGRFRRRKKEKE